MKKTMEEKVESQGVLIDFDGKGREGAGGYDRVVVKDDVYTSKIINIEVQDVKKFNAVGTEKTLIMKVEPIEGKGAIPFFIKPKIMKAYSEKVSNSKLYDLLESAGLLEEAKERKEELVTIDGLSLFLNEKLVGRLIKFFTKLRHQGTENAYSSVDRVLEFLPVGGEIKADVNHQEGASP